MNSLEATRVLTVLEEMVDNLRWAHIIGLLKSCCCDLLEVLLGRWQ
jgi:hypothetical protein